MKNSYEILGGSRKVGVGRRGVRVEGRGGLIREQEMEQRTAPEERRIKTK